MRSRWEILSDDIKICYPNIEWLKNYDTSGFDEDSMHHLRKMTQLTAFTLNSATTALNPMALFRLFIQGHGSLKTLSESLHLRRFVMFALHCCKWFYCSFLSDYYLYTVLSVHFVREVFFSDIKSLQYTF